MFYQNKSAVSDINMNLKVDRLSFQNQFFYNFMIVLTSYKATEDIYGIILPIFIICIMMQNLSDHLEI